MTWVHSFTIKIHEFFYQVQIPSKCNKIYHGSLLHRYLNRNRSTLINGNQYIQRSLLIFLTFSNFIDGRFNMRYTIQHQTSLDKNKEKKREMMLHMTFLGHKQNPITQPWQPQLYQFFSLFMGTWSPKSLPKRQTHSHLHMLKLQASCICAIHNVLSYRVQTLE